MLLLVWVIGWHVLVKHWAAAIDTAYSVVDRINEGDAVVAVVRRHGILFLLYDQTIIGAEFDDPEFRNQAAFPGFAIMQSAAYLAVKPTRALQIGLGIGTVPSFLRAMEIPTGFSTFFFDPDVVTNEMTCLIARNFLGLCCRCRGNQ